MGIVVVWGVDHRLELALKDALKNTIFNDIDYMLLRLYYLYHKSSKKSRELEEVVQSRRHCLEPSKMPEKGGNKPLRACGTRFICHKVAALSRVVDRFGAYIGHLQTLAEDPSTTAADKAKLTGYIRKWHTGRMLLGCAYFHDLLKPAAILCKALQANEICILSTIEALLKAIKTIDTVQTSAFEQLPTVHTVLQRVRVDDSNPGCQIYRGVEMQRLDDGSELLRRHQAEYSRKVISCLQHRVKSEHLDVFRNAITILATHVWEQSDDCGFGTPAGEHLAEMFRQPL